MIYICIPAHNEQQTVGVVLWKLRQVLTDFPRDYQLLVADDASTDKTAEVLEPYTRVLPLTVIRNERRLGEAASLEMLLREAVRRSEYPKRDVIVVLQADFSDEPDDVVALVKRLEAGADVAVGNKVSTARAPRSRRVAQALARFFARGVKWPEGVESPFEGFRAYRLYAVKKAMEDRASRRLVRQDGWAGHADLLRAVLPHARRVDVVNVDDRVDRLQRPRRERPLSAALQVRGLAKEPAGLIGVEELDRIAATTSRSRDRAAVTVQATNGRGRSNGSGSRGDRQASRPSGHARTAGGREERARRGPQAERGAERQPRTRGDTARPGPGDGATAGERQRRPRSGDKPRGERAERPRRPRQEREKPVPAVDAPAALLDEATSALVADAAEAGVVATEGAAGEAKKRRRRRRRRPGAKAAEGGSGVAETGAGPDEGAEGSDPNQAAGESEGDGARRKRRRGGRRGGRGRRPAAAEGEAASAGPDFAPGAAAESAPRVDSD